MLLLSGFAALQLRSSMGLTGRYLTVKVLNDGKDPIGTSFKEKGRLAKGKEKERSGACAGMWGGI